MARKGKCNCRLLVSNVMNTYTEMPLNRRGWAQAKKFALDKAHANHELTLVDLQCDGRQIPLYQCSDGTGCVIESVGLFDPEGSPPIAGLSGCRDARGEFVPSPACRGFRAPSGGRKAKGKKACPHGRVTRGPRKGQCRNHPKRR